MKIEMVSDLQKFLKKERINMELKEISDIEFWFESPDEFMTMKFILDENIHEIKYDIFLPKYDIHLKEQTINDIEKIESRAEIRGLWDYSKHLEDSWLILDFIKIWAQENEFKLTEESLL